MPSVESLARKYKFGRTTGWGDEMLLREERIGKTAGGVRAVIAGLRRGEAEYPASIDGPSVLVLYSVDDFDEEEGSGSPSSMSLPGSARPGPFSSRPPAGPAAA